MSDATSNGSFKQITRHSEYYISSGDLSILVEHTQFRVHRFFFERDSKWFQEQLLKPSSPGTIPQGSSDTNSIILENLTPGQFARFLWVFYNPRYSIYETAYEDWESILRLSERWKFPEVKNLAIRELEKVDITDVKRIKLYHENNVDRNLLIRRYAALCEREDPLTLSEGMDLGMETTLQIAAAREQARLSLLPTGARSPSTPITRGDDLRDIIRHLFNIDAAPVQVTTEESAQNSGALTPLTKQQVQDTKPPLPPKKQTEKATTQTQNPKKSTEKPTTQTQNLKKGKGKQGQATPPSPKTTTPTPPGPTPQPPKEAEEDEATKNDPNSLQKGEEPAPTTTTDSGSGALLDLTSGGSLEQNIDSSQPPSDPYSVFNQDPAFDPLTSSSFEPTKSDADLSSIFGQNSSSATDPTNSVFGVNSTFNWAS